MAKKEEQEKLKREDLDTSLETSAAEAARWGHVNIDRVIRNLRRLYLYCKELEERITALEKERESKA